MESHSRVEALPPLTSIRGFAALSVVIFHVQQTFTREKLFFVGAFQNGHLGVDLFFVLSGFIMAHVYTSEQVRGRIRMFTASFLKSRLARIYPLHLVTLLATLVIIVLLPTFRSRYPGYFGIDTFAMNLLLIQNWGIAPPSWNMISWSISAEWFMYLLFPLLLLLRQFLLPTDGRWTKPVTFGLIIGVLAGHLTAIVVLHWKDYGGMSAGGMVRVFFEFSLGFLVYHVRDKLHPRSDSKAFEWYGLAACSALVLAFLVDRLWLLFVPAAAVLIATLSSNRGWVARVMSTRPMVFLGEISFSLYMWHWLVIQLHNVLLEPAPAGPGHLVTIYGRSVSMVALSLIAATMSFHLVERPARAWISRRRAWLPGAGGAGDLAEQRQ